MYIHVSDFVFSLISSIAHFVHMFEIWDCAGKYVWLPQLMHSHRKPAKEVAVHL